MKPMTKPLTEHPDQHGFFGDYGGQYISEILMPLIHELDQVFHDAIATAEFQDQLQAYHLALHWATFATVLCASINGSLWWCSDLL